MHRTAGVRAWLSRVTITQCDSLMRYDPQVTSSLAVRRATAADIDLVTSIITLAFAHDPLWAHALGRPDGETAHHAEFWRLFVAGALRYPDTWLTSGGEASVVWIPPGGTEMTPGQEQRLADLAAGRLGPAAGDCLELMSRFEAAHPSAEPHYYLTLRGTHPDHRGKGIGMRLLAATSSRSTPCICRPTWSPPIPPVTAGTPAWASSRTASSATPAEARW